MEPEAEPDDLPPASRVVSSRLGLLSDAGLRIGSTLSLGRTAGEVVEVGLEWFCDGVGVYVCEQFIADNLPEFRPSADGSIEVRRLAVGVTGVPLQRLTAVFPLGAPVVFPGGGPYAACVSTATARRFSALSEQERLHVSRVNSADPGLAALQGFTAFLAVPLQTSGRVLGFVVFARSAGPFGAEDVALAGELAVRAAIRIDQACLYQRERQAARALQAGLVPVGLDPGRGLELAHRYLPAGETNLVGGDWLDVFPLADGKVALVVGDAVGHGGAAAAAMVQLRTAARTLAMLGLGPAEVLSWLDRTAEGLVPAQFATCVYAEYEPATRAITIGRAGHPPPILVRAEHGAELLDLPAGLPLGLGGNRYEARAVQLPEGATIAFYTDGLVESRRRDLQTGIDVLLKALDTNSGGLDAQCAALVAELIPGSHEDDATILLARSRTDSAVATEGLRGDQF